MYLGAYRDQQGVHVGFKKLKKILNNAQTNQKQQSLKKKAETALGSQPRLVSRLVVVLIQMTPKKSNINSGCHPQHLQPLFDHLASYK